MLPHNLLFNQNPCHLLVCSWRIYGMVSISALGVTWGNAQTSDGCNQVEKTWTLDHNENHDIPRSHRMPPCQPSLLYQLELLNWFSQCWSVPNQHWSHAVPNVPASVITPAITYFANRRFHFHWPLRWWNGEMWSIFTAGMWRWQWMTQHAELMLIRLKNMGMKIGRDPKTRNDWLQLESQLIWYRLMWFDEWLI